MTPKERLFSELSTPLGRDRLVGHVEKTDGNSLETANHLEKIKPNRVDARRKKNIQIVVATLRPNRHALHPLDIQGGNTSVCLWS